MDSAVTGLVLSLIYFLPTLIANLRGHPSATAILSLNIFLGWTVIFWFIALSASLRAPAPPTHTLQNFVDRHFGPLQEDENK